MGVEQKYPSFLSSLRNKVVVAFLLAISALLLAASTTCLGFYSLLSPKLMNCQHPLRS
jgi:predicted RND superfamily exporter protein